MYTYIVVTAGSWKEIEDIEEFLDRCMRLGERAGLRLRALKCAVLRWGGRQRRRRRAGACGSAREGTAVHILIHTMPWSGFSDGCRLSEKARKHLLREKARSGPLVSMTKDRWSFNRMEVVWKLWKAATVRGPMHAGPVQRPPATPREARIPST